MQPAIFTTTAAAAFAWCRGELTDADLLLHDSLAPEAIFALNLPPHTLRAAVRRVRELHSAGAVILYGHTTNRPWLANLTRRGAVVTFRDASGGVRYLVPPDALKAWMASIPGTSPKTPPPPPG